MRSRLQRGYSGRLAYWWVSMISTQRIYEVEVGYMSKLGGKRTFFLTWVFIYLTWSRRCQKSNLQIHTLTGKKSRTKNIILSWRKVILKKHFENVFLFFLCEPTAKLSFCVCFFCLTFSVSLLNMFWAWLCLRGLFVGAVRNTFGRIFAKACF